eukprot:14952348-Heterocapsa_arctica.AAC.1
MYWQSEGRGRELGNINSETNYYNNCTFPDEQQTINNEAAEVWDDQVDDGRSKGGHYGRNETRSSSHGLTKNKDRQKSQTQCSHGLRSRSATRKS